MLTKIQEEMLGKNGLKIQLNGSWGNGETIVIKKPKKEKEGRSSIYPKIAVLRGFNDDKRTLTQHQNKVLEMSKLYEQGFDIWGDGPLPECDVIKNSPNYVEPPWKNERNNPTTNDCDMLANIFMNIARNENGDD